MRSVNKSPLKIFISAAEPSGDIIAAEVMDYLPKDTNFIGIGGIEMEKHALKSIFPMSDLSVMGALEVLPRAIKILRRINETAALIIKEKPDIILTIDAYSFHSRLITKLKKLGYQGKFHHYVPPAVWAWKEQRAQRLATLYDHVYCIFPFEPPYFTKHNMTADYVGHPAAFRLSLPEPDFRKRYGLSNQPILLILPGSRIQEIKKLLPIFIQSAKLIQEKQSIQIVIPTLPHLEELIDSYCRKADFKVALITTTADRFQAFAHAHAAIAASGTVAMELALNGVPTVIGYKTSWLTYRLAKLFLKIKFITVLNIIANKKVIPEFIQDDCTAENLSQSCLAYFDTNDRAHQLNEIKQITSSLKHESGRKPQELVASFVQKY